MKVVMTHICPNTWLLDCYSLIFWCLQLETDIRRYLLL